MSPEDAAPELMGFDSFSCYFEKQPETEEELRHAISAIEVSCCGAIKYCGTNKEIILKILASPNINPSCVPNASTTDLESK